MGFSVTASHVIWFVAVVGVAGVGLGAFFSVAEGFDAAEVQREAFEAEQLRASLGNVTFCYDAGGQVVGVNATNVGSTLLDIGNVTFLVDGVVVPGFVSAPEAGGGASFWAPGEWVAFSAWGVAREPTSLVLVTQHGVQVRATKVACA